MDSVSVSVIVPIHNTELYLPKCLETIVNQTLKDIEIICVDDASSDDSVRIVKVYMENDPRIHLICIDEPSGSGAKPRNIGLKEAKGEYVVFLDSDDFFDMTMLEKMYRKAQRTGSDLVMCDNYKTDKDGIVLPEDEYVSELHYEYIPEQESFCYKDIPDCIFQISNAAAWHRMILRELINKNDLLFQENVLLDDIFFVNSVLICAKKITIVSEKLVYYRASRPGSQTSSIEKHYISIFDTFNKLNIYLKGNNDYEIIEISLKNWMLSTMEWWISNIKDYQLYKKMFYLYKNEYFYKLGISKLCLHDVIYKQRWFFAYVMLDEYHPQLSEILLALPKKSKIVLYGAGKHGKKMYSSIREDNNHEVVLWCDKNYWDLPDEIRDPKLISEVYFDVVLIAVINPESIFEIRNFLRKYRVRNEKIYEI